MTTQMDWMHYARFSKCAARAPSFPNRAASHLTCLAPRRYHPDNMAKVPDLSLPEPVKGPEPLCKATATDVAKGLWGHALQAEIPYGPLDSSLKVRTPRSPTAHRPLPLVSIRAPLCGADQDQHNHGEDRSAVERAV